jgi:hypothetical protein
MSISALFTLFCNASKRGSVRSLMIETLKPRNSFKRQESFSSPFWSAARSMFLDIRPLFSNGIGLYLVRVATERTRERKRHIRR